MKTSSGYLLHEFKTLLEYDDYVRHAELLGVLTWRSDEKRMFFVTSITQIQSYIRRQQRETANRRVGEGSSGA